MEQEKPIQQQQEKTNDMTKRPTKITKKSKASRGG